MRRHIKLRDLAHIETPSFKSDFPKALLTEARAVLEKRNLRFDNKTGIIRDDRCGELERPSNPRDHIPHQSEVDVMTWEFSRYIGNSASRLQRGYSA